MRSRVQLRVCARLPHRSIAYLREGESNESVSFGTTHGLACSHGLLCLAVGSMDIGQEKLAVASKDVSPRT